jgi:hypothetical protein
MNSRANGVLKTITNHWKEAGFRHFARKKNTICCNMLLNTLYTEHRIGAR